MKSTSEYRCGGVHVRAFRERAHLHVAHGGRLKVDPILVPGAVLPAHVTLPVLEHRATRWLHEPREQMPVEVFPERAADQVQRDRVDARVAVAQAETDDAQHVPEDVVLVLGPRVVVEPQHKHMIW